MKYQEAKIKYDLAESEALSKFGEQNFFDRAKSIEEILDRRHGVSEAGKIIDSVFEGEMS